jgi:DNA-binding response OmpR family regulator
MSKILIIEDDGNLTDLYETQFSMQKYSVLTASDGAQGIEIAIDARPDVILLDVLMPQVNGFEVLKQLKAHKETKDIPVIVYTNLGSSDSDANRELAFSLGAADYLVKALHEPHTIAERVKVLLEGRSEKAEETEKNESAPIVEKPVKVIRSKK